ncbi:hypothetical protein K8T06_09635 [bacterium]|nr:hypothetical protein [bacterium]
MSPGHSGATVCAAKNILGLLDPVKRPGLCQIIPVSNNKQILMIDVGATVSVDPEDRLFFAAMGQAAAPLLTGISSPKIGLLNIGSEPNKGDRNLVDSYQLLSRYLNTFCGNIEGNQIWTGDVDIVVTDGINGNILLKSSEGLVRMILRELLSKKDSVVPLKMAGHFNPSNYGGAVLLGVDGICIICHGIAGVDELVSASELAIRCVRANLVSTISQHLSNFELAQVHHDKETTQ